MKNINRLTWKLLYDVGSSHIHQIVVEEFRPEIALLHRENIFHTDDKKLQKYTDSLFRIFRMPKEL